jgi:hypothetical protein
VEILIVVAVIALIGLGIYVGHRMEQKRAEAMQAVAQAMGFRYAKDADETPQAVAIPDFPLMQRGHSRRVKNLLTGTLADQPAMAMDYSYVIGSGKNRTTHHQTVAIFSEAARGLPDFELAPEHFLHKIGQVFGYQDIDFTEDEEFSKRYLLRGADEAAIRRTITAQARAFLVGHPGWSLQVRGGAVALFQASRRWKPEEVPTRLAESLSILNGLARA